MFVLFKKINPCSLNMVIRFFWKLYHEIVGKSDCFKCFVLNVMHEIR